MAPDDTVPRRIVLQPKLEIVSIDPNYLEPDDSDDCNSCSTDGSDSSISSSSGFKSNENCIDIYPDDIAIDFSQREQYCQEEKQSAKITSNSEKIPENESSIFTDNSEQYESKSDNFDAYTSVVKWLDSAPPTPLFSKPTKVQSLCAFPIKVLDHKRIEFHGQAMKTESQKVDSEKIVACKKNLFNEKRNDENQQMTNAEKPSPKQADKCGPLNNVLFEKNQIDTTNRTKSSPAKMRRKLDLEEYWRRRPNLKRNLLKEDDKVKKEMKDCDVSSKEVKSEGKCVVNSIQNLYEEIIVVSIGSNTDITFPHINNLSDDVPSIKLFTKIASTNTLLASICDVIKKNNSLNYSNNVTDGTRNATLNEEEHGEDKTIMHLRKDRIRFAKTSVGCQTDCDLRFAALESFKRTSCVKPLSSSSSTCSRSSYSSYSSGYRKRKLSPPPTHRTISRNNYSACPPQEFEKSYKRSLQETDPRGTIYVGRIEPTTSQEDLQRKFEIYGSVKNVKTHHQKNGRKYGFVKFNIADDAYKAYDARLTDPNINKYDISFGGRREFCNEAYLDLDNLNVQQSYATPAEPQTESFEDLLRKVKLELENSQKRIK